MLKSASLAVLMLLTATPAFASILYPATNYNVFVFGNMTQSSGSQGTIAVGGNATLSSYSVATNASSSGNNLVIGGNLTASYGSINGNAVVAGNVDYNDPFINGSITSGGNINFHNSGGSVSNTASYMGTYAGPSYISHNHITGPVSLPVNFASARENLEITSDGIASISSNGATGINSGAITFTGNYSATNIFSVSAQQLADANGITINIPTGSDAIINVIGSGNISLPNVGFNFDPAHTLWNLDSFSSITNSSFSGSVLAPYADVTFNSGVFDGTLIAQSLTGGGQFDFAPFTGDLNVPGGGGSLPNIVVPEPTSLSLLALGTTALLIRRRKA